MPTLTERTLVRANRFGGREVRRAWGSWAGLENLESRLLMSVTPSIFGEVRRLDRARTISVPVDNAGNTMGTARNLGALTGTTTLNDFVGLADPNDYYVFSLAGTTNFSLSVTGLTNDADVALIKDANGDKVLQSNEIVAISQNWGTASEYITKQLGAGTYYVRVYRYSGDTNYTLKLTGAGTTPTPTPPAPPAPTNHAPTVATAAKGTPAIVTGKTTTLTVLGADDGGAANLTYTWSVTSPAGATAPTFSANGTNGAQSTVATFSKAGTYVFTATIRDAGGLTVSSAVTITVNQTLTSVTVTPGTAIVALGGTQQFTATAKDQFGNAMTAAITWSTTAGAVSTSGLFTAPGSAATATVTASSGGLNASATVTVTAISNVLNLKTGALANLVGTLDADGSISRTDMIQILRATEADNVVDSNEILDLKTILANKTVLGMSDSVYVLANDIVNGNTANLNFQGAALGNLTVGSTGGQMENLIGKWFYGADHPASSFGYRAVSGSLFMNGIAYTDIQQGQLGDCYYVATLGSIAQRYSTSIYNMFADNGDGTWTVRFFYNGTADYVTVDRMLPTTSSGYAAYASFGGTNTNTSNELWVALAEKAYAQWSETGKAGRGSNVNTYASIEGGWMADVDKQVLGYNASSYSLSSASTVTTLISALTSGKAVTAGSKSSSPGNGVIANHAYIITGYDATTQTFTLYNPWGVQHPAPLTFAQLQQSYTAFVVA